MGTGTDDPWMRPRCGARFVTRNMWHGCGAYTVDCFFAGKPTRLRELYDALVALVTELGPFGQVPTKSRIAFMARVRFAGVVRVRKDGLICVEEADRVATVHEGGAPRTERLDLPIRGEERERPRSRGPRLDPRGLRRGAARRISPGRAEYVGGVEDERSLAQSFLQRAGLGPAPSIKEVVEAIRNVPYARPIERKPEGVVSEWRGTCSTKTALLVELTRFWWPELDPRVTHRLYHLAPDLARTLFGDEAASAIPREGLTDVHTYATLHLEGRRVVVDVTFPGAEWDGFSDMTLACGDGIDFDGGIDPWAMKARLVSENCDADARETFIETVSH